MVTLAGLYAVTVGLSVLYDWSYDGVIQNRWLHLIGGPWIGGLYALMVFTGMVIAPLVVLLPAVAIVAAATGREVLKYFGAATVDAEPLPPGVTAPLVMLQLPDRLRRAGGLRHSLHQFRAVRQIVAQWIQARCDQGGIARQTSDPQDDR